MSVDLSKFIPRFQTESLELLSLMEDGLMQMESGDFSSDLLDDVFRSAHKIKGNSRMLNLLGINELAHQIEDLLDALRNGALRGNNELYDLLLKAIDTLKSLINQANEQGIELKADDELKSKLKAALTNEQLTSASQPSTDSKHENGAAVTSTEESLRGQSINAPVLTTSDNDKNLGTVTNKIDTVRVRSSQLDELTRAFGEIINHQNKLRYRLSKIDVLHKEVSTVLKNGSVKGNKKSPMEFLAFVARELKNIYKNTNEEMSLLDVVSEELQDNAIRLRMLPLSIIFDNLPRTVRDLAREQGKDIKLNLSGKNIEIDKKVIETVGDPILHIVRNAIDHGIELPSIRQKKGKPPQATLDISAEYEGGNAIITISDDGSGINSEKVKANAIKKGLLEERSADSLTDDEIIDYIFRPGFSTADIITDLSGRGVGLDIVRSSLNEIKGSIKVTTTPDEGTRFTLRMPLSLATMSMLFVEVEKLPIAIPINYLSEIINVSNEIIFQAAGREVIRLRDQLVPLAYLSDVLGIKAKGSNRPERTVIIARIDSELIGFIVDEILDQQELVIKPLPLHLKNNSLVTGVVINEKNDLVNVINLREIFHSIRLSSKDASSQQTQVENRNEIKILVVDDSINTREIEKSILESYGYAVDLAVNGKDGYNRALRQSYDLIITDVDMPEMDGFTLTEKLRTEEQYRNTPIIIVTSRTNDEDKRRGIEVGANAYIEKGGFDETGLLSAIENLI